MRISCGAATRLFFAPKQANRRVPCPKPSSAVCSGVKSLSTTGESPINICAPILYETFEQCGMEIHIKKPTDKKAKTVAMLAALPPAVYDGLTGA